MQIDFANRIVRLSVGEFSNYNSPSNVNTHHSNLWRAQQGRLYHEQAQKELLTTQPSAEFEIPVEASWLQDGWEFKLSGRIDQQIQDGNTTLIREIKTTTLELPLYPEELEQIHTNYFTQIACYRILTQHLPDYKNSQILAEIEFINIKEGTSQTIQINDSHKAFFNTQLKRILSFLNRRQNTKEHLKNLKYQSAYTHLREGQKDLIEELTCASNSNDTILLEAPTGFGKTGIVIEHALSQLKSGHFDRVIYLTSKSTGQLHIAHELSRMCSELRYIQMRTRADHAIESPQHTCTNTIECEQAHYKTLANFELQPEAFFQDQTLTLERAREYGSQTGTCPYSLTKFCLTYADFWIGDLNYIFAPQSQSVFSEVAGFDPRNTLLIIDEAHNLPQRVEKNLSIEIDADGLFFMLDILKTTAGVSKVVQNLLEDLHDLLHSIHESPELSSSVYESALEITDELSNQLLYSEIDFQKIPEPAFEYLWIIPELNKRLNAYNHENWLLWSPQDRHLSLTCLDASRHIHNCLKPFGSRLLMSATLSPIDSFATESGIDLKKTAYCVGLAPWRENTCKVAIDTRVNTHFKGRAKHYSTTAETIQTLHQTKEVFEQPIVVFFPSYQYAQNVFTYLETLNPYLRIAFQERNQDFQDQASYLEEALDYADVIFLIIGSSYAEGIDHLGGRVSVAMVVSPALPEVNPVQKAKVNIHSAANAQLAFKQVSIVPGMRKINQAIGRLIRSPKHHSKILLHCRRFAENEFLELLDPELKNNCTIIKFQAELIDWTQNQER